MNTLNTTPVSQIQFQGNTPTYNGKTLRGEVRPLFVPEKVWDEYLQFERDWNIHLDFGI